MSIPDQAGPIFRWEAGHFSMVHLSLWRAGLAEYDDLEGVAWNWQSIDGAMIKSPMGIEAVGPNPTDRGKNGTKRHLLVDGRGVPLSLIVTGANRHDVSQLGPVLDALVMEPPKSRVGSFLYADRGYDGEPAQKTIIAHGYAPRVSRKKRKRGRPPKNRRWVVEAAHSWYNRFRKLLVRFEKFTESYEALLHLASAIICWRKVAPIYGRD